MHIYVFWRAASVPFVNRHVPRKILIGAGVILWAIFFFGRVIGHGGTGVLAGTLEFLGMNWLAVLFLTFITLLVIDLSTIFGFKIRRRQTQKIGVPARVVDHHHRNGEPARAVERRVAG